MLGEERKYRQSHLILFVVSHLSFFLGLYLFPLSRYLLFFFSIVNSVLWGCGFCLILQVLLCPRVCVLVTQSCPTLCGPTDCRLPGFSVRGIFQARILEWVAVLCPYCALFAPVCQNPTKASETSWRSSNIQDISNLSFPSWSSLFPSLF